MTFDDFLSHVLPYVDGCPDVTAVDFVRKAAREFCSRTLVWNYEATPIVAQIGIQNYTLQLAPDRELVRLLRLDVDRTQYTVPNATDGRAAQRRGWSNVAVMQGPQDFTITPAPSVEGQQIYTDLAVRPKLDSNYWPDDLGEHVTDIAHGAIAMLCLVPRKEWTDSGTAATQGAQFEDRMNVVGLKVSRARGASRPRSNVGWF